MGTITFYLSFFFGIFVIVFGVYKIIFKRKVKKGTINKTIELSYLIPKFNLNKLKINYPRITTDISLINAFIIAFVSTLVTSLPYHMVFQLLIGFVMLFALIYSLYEIYGRHIYKKWGKRK